MNETKKYDLSEFVELKKGLDRRIQSFLNVEISKFQKETGFVVTNLIVDTVTLSGGFPKYDTDIVIVSVKTKVEI